MATVADDSFVLKHATSTNLLVICLSFVIIQVSINAFRAPKYPTSIPWVGHKGWFSDIKNSINGITNSKTWMQEGYEKYSKKNQHFVFPGLLGTPAETVLPRSELNWLVEQPDNVLSTLLAHQETLQGDYSFVQPVILREPYHEHVIHKNLAKKLNALIPDIAEEVEIDLEEYLGIDVNQYKSINVMDLLMTVIPKISNRMFVGAPLCRNKEYLSLMIAYTNDVVRNMVLLPFCPTLIKPIVGRVLRLATQYHHWRTKKWTVPMITKRISDIEKKESNDSEYTDWKPPNDFLTWIIQTAKTENRYDELTPERISMRIMPLNFASIHTTALTGVGCLLDIYSAGQDVVDSLREELTRVLSEEGGQWTKQGLAQLFRLDSAIRESQRISAFALSFCQRKVVVAGGISTPSGLHLAQGIHVSCPWSSIAGDDDIYAKSKEYNAFRFSKPREEYEALPAEDKAKVDNLKLRQLGLVTTSDKMFAFGHGRHAW